jgi:hypothetical protein
MDHTLHSALVILQPFCCSCPQTMMAAPNGIRRNCTLLRLRMSDFCWRQRLSSIRGMPAAQMLVSPRPRLLVFGLTLDGRSIAVRERIHFPRRGVSTTRGDAVKRQTDGNEGSSQTLRVTHVIAVFSRSGSSPTWHSMVFSLRRFRSDFVQTRSGCRCVTPNQGAVHVIYRVL